MKLEIPTQCYNDRRYGKPWCAVVTFETAKGNFTWGEWCGEPGRSGLLILEVQPGDVIATGQRDHRKMRNSAPEFFIVMGDGECRPVTKPAAYKHWNALKIEKATTLQSTAATRALSIEDGNTTERKLI